MQTRACSHPAPAVASPAPSEAEHGQGQSAWAGGCPGGEQKWGDPEQLHQNLPWVWSPENPSFCRFSAPLGRKERLDAGGTGSALLRSAPARAAWPDQLAGGRGGSLQPSAGWQSGRSRGRSRGWRDGAASPGLQLSSTKPIDLSVLSAPGLGAGSWPSEGASVRWGWGNDTRTLQRDLGARMMTRWGLWFSRFSAEQVNSIGLRHPNSRTSIGGISLPLSFRFPLILLSVCSHTWGKRRKKKAINSICFAFEKICHFAICRRACSATIVFV